MKIQVPAGELETYFAFTDEAKEHLDSVEQRVLSLVDAVDADAVNTLFRALHTIKGVASFLGLSDIQKLSHVLESVFDNVRQGILSPDEGMLATCLESLDLLSAMLGNLRTGLDAKVALPDGSAEVEFTEVEYHASYVKLEAILKGGKADPEPAPTAAAAPTSAAEPASEDLVTPEMLIAFVKEAGEFIDTTEQVFLTLIREPANRDALDQAFRNIHSFKGNCGFFGFADLEKVSHRLETLLETVRETGAPCPAPVQDASLRCLDLFRTTVARLISERNPAIPGARSWVEALERMASQGLAVQPIPEEWPGKPGDGGAVSDQPRLGEILIAERKASAEDIAYALKLQQRPLGQILVEEGLAPKEAVEEALQRQNAVKSEAAAGNAKAPAPAAAKETKRDLRVDLTKLDQLLDLVGELVISTGMVFNHPVLKESGAPDLERIAHQLKGVVSDLQSVALGVRMIPVEGPFRKMTRLVHDLSSKSGKKVRLELKGEETEIDKNVADLIADPLVHMIRNSVDHGLEAPQARIAAGKDPCGTVTLEASQEGGDILITIKDDGRGMSREKILRKAMEKGLVDGDGANLPDSEVFQYIFMPGFSTAEAITATSGRGVGMDVVKSNIEKLNGRITIESKEGQGSSINLRLPLTLSIIDGMLVRVGGSLFTLPLTSVRESIAPNPGSIFTLGGAQETLMLRGNAYPIVRLHQIQGIEDGFRNIAQGLLMSLESRGTRYCLFVDELLGQRQTVVKALPPYLGKIPGVSSCSILDNGEISLILDVSVLFQLHVSRQGGNDRKESWTPVMAEVAS